jgi:hypothetical protein
MVFFSRVTGLGSAPHAKPVDATMRRTLAAK